MSGTVQTAFVKTRIGDVRYARAGAGQPLVLLHGNGHSWREFEPALDALAARFDVIAWDMPGQGESADIAASSSIANYADVLGDVIESLALQRPALLGSSIGAFIAAESAAKRSDISALVLEEMQFRTRDWWLAAWPVVERMFGTPTQSLEQVQPRFRRKVDAHLLAEWNAGRERAGGAGLVGVMAAIRDYPLAEILPRIKTPTLILFGAHGPTIETGPQIQAAMPKAALRVIEDAGHFISLDQPAAFAGAVIDFLTDASAGARAGSA